MRIQLLAALICLLSLQYSHSQGDTCGSALALPAVTTTCTFANYTNVGATDSTTPPPSCGGYAGQDVWFSFVVPAGGTIEIDTQAGTMTDGAMALYTGGCGALTQVDCDDDDGAGLMPFITATGLTPGTTAYIRFWDWGGGTGTFNLCVYEPPPPPPPPSNDDCSGAINLNVEYVCNFLTYSNESATGSSVPNPACPGYSGGDVWFSAVVPDNGYLLISTEDQVVIDGGLAVYTGSCGSLTEIACNDDTNGLMPEIELFGQTPGSTIYIRFWEYGNNNNGDFGICVTTYIPPGTNGVNICPGDPSEPLTSDLTCSTGGVYVGGDDDSGSTFLEPRVTVSLSTGITYTMVTTVYGVGNTTASGPFTWNISGGTINGGATQINGNLNAGTDPVADRPIIFIESNDPCNFVNTTSNYVEFNFTVDSDGVYDFEMANNTVDHIGYIYYNGMTPGVCPTTAALDWYDSAVGGTLLGSGNVFDPVGVDPALPDTNTGGIWSYFVECPLNPGVRVQADYRIGKSWNGSVNNDWNEAGNWTPFGVPSNTDCVVIPNVAIQPVFVDPGIPLPTNPGFAESLRVEANATLDITSDSSLEITNEITVEPSGELTVQDGGSLIQINDSAVNQGDIKMERTVTGLSPDDYVYWSSPVAGFTVTDVSPGTNTNAIWHWIPTVGNNFGEWQNTTENMIAGKGYIVRDVIGTVTADTPLFEGVPNNGIITRTIQRGTYTGADYTGPGDTDVTALDDNWNLVGNPYPSAVSYASFISNNPEIDGTIYLWTHQSAPSNAVNSSFYEDFLYNYNPNDYIDNNYTGSNPPGFNGNIAAGQSFFTLMLDTGSQTETVTFNNSMRGAALDNTVFYDAPGGSQSQDSDNGVERHRFWLDLITPNNLATSILIGYVDGATNGNDRLYDGYEFPATAISFYSIISQTPYSIQGRALPFDEGDSIPLGFTVPVNETYQIAINSVDGLFENNDQNIFIEDTYNDIIHNLNEAPYSFYSEEGNFEDRFIIRFNNEALSDEEFVLSDELTIISYNEEIRINSTRISLESVVIYDLLGRVVYSEDRLNEMQHLIDSNRMARSAYFVEVELADGRKKIKKIVN